MISTEEEAALRRSVKTFADRHVLSRQGDFESAGRIDAAVLSELGASGLLGVGYEPELGGSGGGLYERLIILDEFLRCGVSSGVCSAMFTRSISVPHLIDAKNENHIERWVKPTLAGAMIGSLAITEPGGGSDVANLRTTAQRNGDIYVVSGEKAFITSSTRASYLVTAVRTGGPGAHGISLLVIEPDMVGVSVSPPLQKLGWRASDTADIHFDGVEVPVENLVGIENRGFELLMNHFADERLILAGHACGIAQRCLDLSVAWANSRETFSRTLIEHQVVRHKLAEMSRQVVVARAFMFFVAQEIDSGNPANVESAMAKRTATAAAEYSSYESIQIHGGAGYMQSLELERQYRDARILSIGGGTTEILNEIIARPFVEKLKRRDQ
jgi:acyl-CoA dehydrogenase